MIKYLIIIRLLMHVLVEYIFLIKINNDTIHMYTKHHSQNEKNKFVISHAH